MAGGGREFEMEYWLLHAGAIFGIVLALGSIGIIGWDSVRPRGS